MNFYGTIKRVVELWFRKDANDVKLTPNANTYTGTTSFSLPPKTSGSGVLVGEAETQTLTNKTIAAGSNTITGLADTNIASNAAIDATKIGAGTVSNTEFGYLDGVTSAIQTQFTGKQSTSEKGQANGYASLDSGGKIPASQLPNSVMEYQGTWNANTNSPTLADGAGNAGDVYIVSVAGSQDLGSGSISFAVGDWIVYNGSVWQKSVNSNAVASVNGFTGAVVLTTSDISEGSNLYFTNGRVDTQVATYKYTTTWTSGTTKSITHSLGTRDIQVAIYDNTTFEEIGVDTSIRTDANTLDLTASEAPSGSGWTVVISKA